MATNQARKLIIWNMAANKVSAAAIETLTEASVAADACRATYDNVKRECLEYHSWNWATAEAALRLLKTEHDEYLYLLPTDYVYAVRLERHEHEKCRRPRRGYRHPLPFCVELTKYNADNLRVIKTPVPDAYLTYVADVEENLFSAHFTNAVGVTLAAEISRAVINDVQIYQALRQEGIALLQQAKTVDMAEEQHKTEYLPRDRRYLKARCGYKHRGW